MMQVQHQLLGMHIQRHLDIFIHGLLDIRMKIFLSILKKYIFSFRIHAAIKLTLPNRQELINKLT